MTIELTNEDLHNAINEYIKHKLAPGSKLVKFSITNLRNGKSSTDKGYKARAEIEFTNEGGEK